MRLCTTCDMTKKNSNIFCSIVFLFFVAWILTTEKREEQVQVVLRANSCKFKEETDLSNWQRKLRIFQE